MYNIQTVRHRVYTGFTQVFHRFYTGFSHEWHTKDIMYRFSADKKMQHETKITKIYGVYMYCIC